jgi:hypothetical protein
MAGWGSAHFPRHARPLELAFDTPALEQRGCRRTNGGDWTVERALKRAGWVADLIGFRREMSLCLVDALQADLPDLAKRPGFMRENRRITPSRRTRETHIGRGQGSISGPLPGSGRWPEAPVA